MKPAVIHQHREVDTTTTSTPSDDDTTGSRTGRAGAFLFDSRPQSSVSLLHVFGSSESKIFSKTEFFSRLAWGMHAHAWLQ